VYHITMLPERIGRLDELANNLWWSWHPELRTVFRSLDYQLWRISGHNPVKQLRELSPDKLQAAAGDPAFLTLYDSALSAFDADMSGGGSWFAASHPNVLAGPVAYFSMEFAIHNSLPIYAGGLGVLAGDVCKEASDLGLPLVGVGFMYPQGYFHQHISAEGWQEEIYQQLDFSEAPVSPVLPREQRPPVQIQLADRSLAIGVWQVRAGRVSIYLLSTDIEGNAPEDRLLSNRLYTADEEQRLQQEMLLGIGGVRALRELGIEPSVWHANEGHTAFMMLERIREEVEGGASFLEAARRVRSTIVFTTHTPVMAGHHVYPFELIEKYFQGYWESLGLSRDQFLGLGQLDDSEEPSFNMTVLALKMAGRRNAVSQLHGRVTRKMWHGLWPEVKEDEVPISYITNGVHVPNWVAPEMGRLYDKYLGQDGIKRQDDAGLWRRAAEIPDAELWQARQVLKRKLMGAMVERARDCSTDRECSAQQVMAMGALLDPEVLTIGFARRFTEYKRPALVFYDVERLRRIVVNPWRPVQIVFAGKSHPADYPSKELLHQVYTLGTDGEFQGRIAFVEDYDMHIAHYLVQGVDLWLNTPRRPREACGSSGIKASMNGVLNLSVKDGWWYEGYNGANGWAISNDLETTDPAEEDKADAESLYDLLENEIVPLYYERDRDGVPHRWLGFIKEAISSVMPAFCAQRMLKEYTERMYLPAAQSREESEIPQG
jgi:starch phosphorylase